MNNSMRKPNGLIYESSPYLLQHAYNPVEWFPWGDEAISLARETDRLILVSVGYSACHWCHVMERESFEDEEVAALMNKYFVCIKVDREERPDVDQVFMEAVQMIKGQGGWPLNCFALPDGRPLWGGTYFRRHHWMQILQQFARMWELKDESLLHQAENLQNGMTVRFSVKVVHDQYDAAGMFHEMARKMLRQCDNVHGGQKGAPKFPMPDLVLFQWLLAEQNPDPGLYNHVLLTLNRMLCGGIFDQLEGGFARYSVDERWHVPHFEKMLYDNAQLISLYSEVSRSTGHKEFEMVVRMTIRWCISNLYRPGEMFCSALDADSEGEEGRFYVWTQQDFDLLPPDLSPLLSDWFGIGAQASWEHGTNVLVRPYTLEEFCTKHMLDEAKWQWMLTQGINHLLSMRNQRSRPAIDDKQLLAWNALMIKGLCKAYKTFGEREWLEIARKVEAFIRQNLSTDQGGLLRSYKNNIAKTPAFLDDYTFYIQSLTALYQCTFDESCLLEAYRLTNFTLRNFYLNETGLFNFTSHDNNDLVIKPREVYDSVIPSSNAAMCLALTMMGIYFEDEHLLSEARKMLRNQARLMEQYPAAFNHWGQALWLLEHQEITVFKGENAARYAIGKLNHLHHLQLIAAADGSSSIPAVASKENRAGLWRWTCNQNGCRIPEQIIEKDFTG